eukprot:CCRYP_008131-RA/>CCRYP_008131-RA protein AED:0.42 eAED:0.42 QI:0/-1/0/1/-1/1/1/0/186
MTDDADLETAATTTKPLLHAEELHGSISPNASTPGSPETSFLDAAAAVAEAMASDVECQQSAPTNKPQGENFEISSRGDEETASSFSVDSSHETKTKFQDMLSSKNVIDNNNIFWNTDDDRVPFPSINVSIDEYNKVVNVCPCRCLFFTLKETLCLVMSVLGCAVFFTGLVFLCLFLEGSWFENKQ